MKTKVIRSSRVDFAELVLIAALRRAGLDREILSSPQTHENVIARGKIYALMRAHTSPKCARLPWGEIARVCGLNNRPSIYWPLKRFEELNGAVSSWTMEGGKH
jgi:hypothetical protein